MNSSLSRRIRTRSIPTLRASAVLTALAGLMFLAACSSPTRRVSTLPDARAVPYPLPPPPPARPQVMIHEPVPFVPDQVMVETEDKVDAMDAPEAPVAPVGRMTEAERTEIFRAVGSPIRPYTPAIPAQAPSRTVVVESYAASPSYYGGYYSRPAWWDFAAAGASFAMFTAPMWMCGFPSFPFPCWD